MCRSRIKTSSRQTGTRIHICPTMDKLPNHTRWVGQSLEKSLKRVGEREWYALTRQDGKRGAESKEWEVNLVIANQCMHDDDGWERGYPASGRTASWEDGACRSRLGDWIKRDEESGIGKTRPYVFLTGYGNTIRHDMMDGWMDG